MATPGLAPASVRLATAVVSNGSGWQWQRDRGRVLRPRNGGCRMYESLEALSEILEAMTEIKEQLERIIEALENVDRNLRD